MAAYDLVMHGTRSSAAMVLIYLSRNIRVSALDGLTHWPLGNLNEILNFVIFERNLVIAGWGISCEIALIWMSLDLTDDQSTLVQVMAWCRQATSHYLSQCWPRSLSPYGVTRPQWVKMPWGKSIPSLKTDNLFVRRFACPSHIHSSELIIDQRSTANIICFPRQPINWHVVNSADQLI